MSDGRRVARNLPDVAELLVARRLGRDLRPWEGCLVQLLAAAAFFGLVYWFFTSGLFFAVAQPLVDWFVRQIHLGPTRSPTP